MSTISSCPKCQKSVSVPSGVDLTTLVRCPLCAAEYPLGEALPPELIPVLVATHQAPVAAGTVELEGAIEQEMAGESREEEKRTLGYEERALEHDENEAAAVAMGQTRLATMAAVRGRQPKSTSGLKRLIGIVGSGLAGLLVGYYVLAFWFGPELKKIGFPELPLPYVAWLTAAPANTDAAGEKPSEEKSAHAKPANGTTSLEAPDAGKTPENKLPPATIRPKTGSKPLPSGTSNTAP
jgi:hypothetical protein